MISKNRLSLYSLVAGIPKSKATNPTHDSTRFACTPAAEWEKGFYFDKWGCLQFFQECRNKTAIKRNSTEYGPGDHGFYKGM